MAAPAELSNILGRIKHGHALCTVKLAGAERATLGSYLRCLVERQGVIALTRPSEHVAAFALFGAEYFAAEADLLVWAPLLAQLGVAKDQLDRYSQLYEPLERFLASLGRPVRRTPSGERRFLGSLLREGGLPARIGDLPERIRPLIARYGWEGLRDVEARERLAQEVAQAATGVVRNVLDGQEGVAALAALLDDVRLARLQLVAAGVDPKTLRDAQQARAALEQAQVALPSVRNERLLLALLGTFNVLAQRGPALVRPLRFVLHRTADRARLMVRYELADLPRVAALVDKSHVALVVQPSPDGARLVTRDEGGAFYEARSGERHAEWRRGPMRGPTTLEARAVAEDGSAQIEAIDVLEWPSDSLLWFNANGERVLGEPDALAVGVPMYVLTQGNVTLEAEGDVVATPLPGTCGLKTFVIDVGGEGVLHVRDADGARTIVCGHRSCNVKLVDDYLVDGTLSTKLRKRLPTLIVPPDIEAVLSAAGYDGRFVDLRRVRGLVRLSDEPGLSGRNGLVRVRLRTDTGDTWSARWSVLPERLSWRSKGGELVVEAPPDVRVEALGASVIAESARVRVVPHAVTDRVELRLRLPSGEILPVPVVAPRPGVHLRKAPAFVPEPLSDKRLTEREILEGAYLTIDDSIGASLELLTRLGERVLRVIQRSARPVLVHLDSVLETQRQDREYRLPLRAIVKGASGETTAAFEVVTPRRSAPEVNDADGELKLRVPVDSQDTPRTPALALFPVLEPLCEPAFVQCELAIEGDFGVVHLPPNRLPTTRGMYVTALVDLAGPSPRSMSGCRLINVPLGPPPKTPPPELDPLKRALWSGQTREMSAEIDSYAARRAAHTWLELLEKAAYTRAKYGLYFFKFFDAIIGESPWVIVAIAARMMPPERTEWFAMWAREPSFTWLKFRKKDAALLAKVLPTRLRSEEKMAIIAAAEAARPMPRTVRHALEQAFFRGDSARPIEGLYMAELGVAGGVRLPGDWSAIALPKANSLAQRWMFGHDFAGDQQTQIDEQLAKQVLKGQRVRAIRLAFERLRAWREDFNLFQVDLGPSPALAWSQKMMAACFREWDQVLGAPNIARGDSVRERLRRVDVDALHAAILLHEWHEGLSTDVRTRFPMIQKLERLVPELLGAWLAALTYVS